MSYRLRWDNPALPLLLLPLLLLADVCEASAPCDCQVDYSVAIPMRDGVVLRADVYRPRQGPVSRGAILVRTPYGKTASARRTRSVPLDVFVRSGFVVVIEDWRGKGESEGKFHWVGNHSESDGYDTIDWISKQPWSNGNVGTYGCSALGEEQIYAAAAKHPAHKAMIPQAAGTVRASADERYTLYGWRRGGVYELSGAIQYFIQARLGGQIHLQRPAGLSSEEWGVVADQFNLEETRTPITCTTCNDTDKFNELARTLPIINLAKPVDRVPDDFYDDLTHEPGDPYWEQFDSITDASTFSVPGLHVNSWYDIATSGTFWQVQFIRSHSVSPTTRDNQYVVISPTVHCESEDSSTEHTVIGQRDLGDARFPFYDTYVRWFRYWLNNDKSAFKSMPHYQYFVMGLNKWDSSEVWPLAGTHFTNFYLQSDGHANSSLGDGRLTRSPASRKTLDSYTSDPGNPVESVGGSAMLHNSELAGSYDQRAQSSRNDVLAFTTEPLDVGIEVTGPVALRLAASSTAKDTDFFATLVDVYPDGRAFNVASGVLRARYRNGRKKPELLNPNQTYKVAIDLGMTSNYFSAGHRIQLLISSTNFPAFERNLQTGGRNYDEDTWVVATNRVYVGALSKSVLVLPVVHEAASTHGHAGSKGT